MTTNTSISINQDGTVELSVIDYDNETGPFWYVEVDGTPVLPERPLPLEHALATFRREVAEAAEYDSTVELRQCDDSDLKWAGIEVSEADDDE